MSRWDTPIFAMVFASTLRMLLMLEVSRLSLLKGELATSFYRDLKIIAESKAADFEHALAYEQHQGAQSLIQVFQSPKVSEHHKAAHTALKHVLMQTATVPLTEGNKVKVRHQSHSLTLHFGALKLFLTCNFADTYSPITMMLYSGCNAPLVDDDGPMVDADGHAFRVGFPDKVFEL